MSERRRVLWVFRLLACAAWLMAAGCAARSPGRRTASQDMARSFAPEADEMILERDAATGFAVLAVRRVLFVKPGTFVTVENSTAALRLWQDFELPDPPPSADFSAYVVAVFFELDVCHGGNGFSELRRLFVRSDGRVRAEFARDPQLACADSRGGLPPTIAYVLALRRDRLPEGRDLTLGPARVVLKQPIDEGLADPACARPEPPPRTEPSADSVLSAPAPGSVSLQYLSDGTPVFVVRHEDAGLDVLATDVPSWSEVTGSKTTPVRGLREQIRWYCDERRFVSSVNSYDEYGVPTYTTEGSSLDRFRTTSLGDGSVRVSLSGRGPGYGPRRAKPASRVSGRRIEAYGATRAVDLGTGRQRPAGSRVVVDADLVVGGGSLPRLCARTSPPCNGAVAPALGITWGGAGEKAFPGPFAARVAHGGFMDITSIQPTFDEGPQTQRHGLDSFHLEGSLSALGALDSVVAHLGGEAGVIAHTGWSTARGLMLSLVGAGTGVTLRGRWLVAADSGRSEFRMGVAPIFEHSGWERVWVYPSPLGLAIPEVGVGGGGGARAFPYLAWSLPIIFHMESRVTRGHPFDARDVLGFRLAPTALLSFRSGSTDWLYAVSLGMTIW